MATTPTFYPFSRLPRELRAHIWELTIEPREVRVRRINPNPGHFSSPTPVPATLQACQESRCLLESFYTKAFVYEDEPPYIWVNFNVDSVRMRDSFLHIFIDRNPSVRRLVIDVRSPDHIVDSDNEPVPGLENVESVIFYTVEELDFYWTGWIDIMVVHTDYFNYLRSERPGFTPPNMRIIDVVGYEMNSGNWRRLDRQSRRAIAALYQDDTLVSDDSS